MLELVRDARYAARILFNAPGFTFAAVLTLALGIGANVAMFSVLYGVLLKPLPYRNADRLIVARAEVDYVGAHRPLPIFLQTSELPTWQRPLHGIAAIAFSTSSDIVALSSDSGSEVLESAVVSPTFFPTIGGPLSAGRPLDSADDATPVVVISERLARRLFATPERAISRQLVLTRHLYTIVGVADRDFQFPRANVDVWMPVGFVHSVNSRCCAFQPVARLHENGTLERAREAIQPMFQGSLAAQGRTANAVRTSVVGLRDQLVASVRPALVVLFASVLMVLLVACGNLINLLLARNAARGQEFAIRRALGASAGRLMRQLLVESALLGVAGAALGAVLARMTLAALSRAAAAALPRMDAVHLDLPPLLFAAGLAALATVSTGLAPAMRAVRGAAIPSQASGGTATSWSARRLQRAMCVAQVALAVILLVGATLMSRSLVRLLHVDLGVDSDHVLTASLNLAFGERPSDAQALARINAVIDRVRALPGVRAAGVGTGLPPSASRIRITLRRSGETADYQAAGVPATPGYFSALHMRLIKGRFFTDEDDERHPAAVILSEDTAKRFFGSEDPIGRTMSVPMLRNGVQMSVDTTVVGVTANVKYAGLAAPADDIVYRPFAQQPWVAPFLVVRTSGDPAALGETVRRAIAEVDQGIVVSAVTTLDQLVVSATAQPQFRTVLLTSLAALAIGIAAVGLYGVVAYTVSRRTREIGIRIALGASSHEVLAMVLRDGLSVALAGIVLGVACALMVARLLVGLLYGIEPTDPVSFILAAVGLLALTLLSSYIPARRASRIDPIGALRTE